MQKKKRQQSIWKLHDFECGPQNPDGPQGLQTVTSTALIILLPSDHYFITLSTKTIENAAFFF